MNINIIYVAESLNFQIGERTRYLGEGVYGMIGEEIRYLYHDKEISIEEAQELAERKMGDLING